MFGNGTNCRYPRAAIGDGVLFFDPEAQRDHRTAPACLHRMVSDGLERHGGLRSYFDSNGDGKLTSADAAFAQFKVLVTNADGSTTVKTLAQLGITEINLTEDATRVELADGSVIEGQTSYKKADGSTGTVASTALVANRTLTGLNDRKSWAVHRGGRY